MRVMRVLTRPNLGGPTRQAISLWHAHRTMGVRTLLVTGVVDGDEVALSPEHAAVPRLSLAAAEALGPEAEGWVEVTCLRRGINPLADWRALGELRRLVRAQQPQVVHTHTSKAGWLGRRAARAHPQALVAHTFHGHVLHDYFGRTLSALLRRLERRTARQSDLLFAVSPSCADELAGAGVASRETFLVVPPAVALPDFLGRPAARRQLRMPERERCVVCIGRLVPIKRVDHFVRMIAALPSCTGDVVGHGPEHQELEALAARLAPGRVRFRGAMPDIAALLPAYDALVLPSVREGCPLVAVEAFAAGVPVLGYDVPGVQDALRVWGQGELVPATAGPHGLATALEGIFSTPERSQRRSEANRAAAARFAPATVARSLLESYRGHRRYPVGVVE